jgi:HlyD family secretion protein
MPEKTFSKSLVYPLTTLFALGVLIVGGITAYNLQRSSQTEVKSDSIPTEPEIKTVTALGKLEPKGEVIHVSATSFTQKERVKKLLVQEGDYVDKDQTIAILDTRDSAAAALKQAEARVRVAQANLEQVQAGAEQGEINAQKARIARIKAERNSEITAQEATVARLRAELKNAKLEYQRYQQLYVEGAIPESQRDNKQLIFETAQKQLEQAKANLQRIQTTKKEEIQEAQATLEGITQIRPEDIERAVAEVREAQATVAVEKVELDFAYVKAPQSGRILDIISRPGESVASEGIVTIGQTDQMYAVAEVYESDIGKVQLGQPVKITSNAISGELNGTVAHIDSQVQRQEVISTDPAANTDAKVVEVKVRLNPQSNQKAKELTNLLVKVAITVSSQSSN